MFNRLQKFINNHVPSLKSNRSSSFKAAILVFLVSLFGTSAFLRKIEQNSLIAERHRAFNTANDYVIDIQRNLERTLSVTYALAALIHQYQGVIPNFEAVAQNLLPLYSGAYALAVLPEGKTGEIISEAKNQAVLRQQYPASEQQLHSLPQHQFQNFNHTQEVLIAKKTGELTLASPFNFVQGSSSAIGYLPIFFKNDQRKNYFWGFSAVVIQFPEILKNLQLKELEQQGFAYQIWRIHPETNQKQILAASSIALKNNPVEHIINLPNAKWRLSLTPINGWNRSFRFKLGLLLCFCFSLTLAILVKLFFDSKAHALELEKVAYFDPLTGLPNSQFLFYRLERILAQTQRNNKNMAICYLDLDNFKLINDHLGRKAGDYLLVRIAKRLQKFIRVEDVIARVSEDEFVIVLQDLSHLKEAELILQRIIEAVTTPITLKSQTISVSTSIGMTIYPQDKSNINTLLAHAKQAMCYTKQHLKGSYTLFGNLVCALKITT